MEKTVFFNGFPSKKVVQVHSNASSTLKEALVQAFGKQADRLLNSFYLTHESRIVCPSTSICSLEANVLNKDVNLWLCGRVLGGKGGFGSQLRAAGGRMSKKRNEQENQDSCRDLDGNRLGTVREAKELSEYLAKKPSESRAKKEEKKQKLKKLLSTEQNVPRFDDHEFLEDIDNSVSETRNAFQSSLAHRRGSSSAVSFSSSDQSSLNENEPSSSNKGKESLKEGKEGVQSHDSWLQRMEAAASEDDDEDEQFKALDGWDDEFV
ncbi:intron-specific pre-mRNA splicing-ubiquitin fusion protein Sde2 [Schizosaccharomyces osmophilus]|uniref:Intron-specific pre-mRNA splicing-ubiquitin fusion protein Sde2 n=1 Tax=Schizosaccharomyces osmophilus TaxID=2545709 RepID=A0AAF0AUP5_9SCHI|nr:intron-specific pre-mRNA splicing-ubiquitin fusion protein Sde2 [Schizosaccharomyces osmophilus]WBW71105.1 intron-specific pre-mRNA splicing-ubiquitin fusion protein Sde2 [Schizosaccharomyces osmophilus]